MSESLTSSLRGGSIDSCLNEIDTRASEDTSSSFGQHVVVGPFSVLRQDSSAGAQVLASVECFSPHLQPLSQSQLHSDVIETNVSNRTEMANPLLAFYDADTVPSLSDSLQWDDLFELSLETIFETSYQTVDPLMAFETPTLAQTLFTTDQSWTAIAEGSSLGDTIEPVPAPTLVLSPAASTGHPNSAILTLAPKLLKHFKDTVIEHICALPITTKSPFEIINLASAVDTFAHLTFLRSTGITRAKLAGLYSLLSVSAAHLAGNPRFDVESQHTCSYWKSLSQAASYHATQYLQQSIKEENHRPHKAKYKDQVVATMNLMTYSVSKALAPILLQLVSADRIDFSDHDWRAKGCSSIYDRYRTPDAATRPR